MPKRKLLRLEDYARALKAGYGLGARELYTPWLRVNDVSSKGLSSKVPGIKVNREHHFLSQVESGLFYYLEYDQDISDIREQFPLLPLDLVDRVSIEAGLNIPRTGHGKSDPVVLSTDILATRIVDGKTAFEAYAVKTVSDLEEESVRERLELERLWWTVLGVPWYLVTDAHIDKAVVENLMWASDPLRGTKVNQIEPGYEEAFSRFLSEIEPGLLGWPELVEKTACYVGFASSQGEKYLRRAIWEKQIIADLSYPIIKQGVIRILRSSSKLAGTDANDIQHQA